MLHSRHYLFATRHRSILCTVWGGELAKAVECHCTVHMVQWSPSSLSGACYGWGKCFVVAVKNKVLRAFESLIQGEEGVDEHMFRELAGVDDALCYRLLKRLPFFLSAIIFTAEFKKWGSLKIRPTRQRPAFSFMDLRESVMLLLKTGSPILPVSQPIFLDVDGKLIDASEQVVYEILPLVFQWFGHFHCNITRNIEHGVARKWLRTFHKVHARAPKY